MRQVTVLAALLLLAPATSQAKTLDDLLVEKGVITKAEALASSGSAASKTYWKDGTRFEFPDAGFTMKLNTQIQSRYTFTDADEDAGDENTSSFSMRRVRLIASGSALHEEFQYMLQTDFVGAKEDDGARSPEVRDVWLKWNGCDWVSIKMGQFKTQISRQFNNSSSKLQFTDRSLASEFFDLDRQAGAAAEFKGADDMWTASVGIFNGISDGEGINKPGVDTKHTGVVAVRVNPMGKMDAYEEGDISWTEEAAVSIGAAYAYSAAEQSAAGGDVDQSNISVDANFKWQGWSVHGEYFYQTWEPDADGADEVEPSGFYAQVGYFLDPKKWEIAGRYSYLDCDDGAASGTCSGNEEVSEVTAGLAYHWWKHNLKAQLNYVHTNEDTLGDGDDVDTNKWIFQVSSYF